MPPSDQPATAATERDESNDSVLTIVCPMCGWSRYGHLFGPTYKPRRWFRRTAFGAVRGASTSGRTPKMAPDTAACVRCGNALGPDDFFEDGETRPHVIHNSDEPDERTEGPLCMRDFRIGVGLGVWHECPTCGGRGKVREPGT